MSTEENKTIIRRFIEAADTHNVGLAVFAIGVMDVALMLWIPLIWKYTFSPSSGLLDFPLLSASPNPLATWLQSVFIGAILVVRGAFIYTRRPKIVKGLILTALSAILTLISMISFTSLDVNLSLASFIIALVLFVV